HLGFAPDKVRAGVDFYRVEYAEKGIHMAEVYSKIPDLLNKLAQADILTAVATLKREDFAVSMMKEFGLSDKLTLVRGMDAKDTRTKASIIEMCLADFGVSPQDAVLVGDSISDADGAKLCGVDFIGVSYGWGFDSAQDIMSGYYTNYADSVEELIRLL
ncbi:MAG: HAD family hydrolase, partial [Oscillospiraceae bacterium]